jgi:pectate lyase
LIAWTAFTVLNSRPSRPVQAAPAVKAFPGAMGYGTDTPGGRGGKVFYVTNLNDSGPGSLREALTAPQPRMVLFRVSGTITLLSDVVITSPFLTVAGHTAPGEGVQIRGDQLKIATHDIVIRYLKVRSGDASNASNPADRDATTLNDHTQVYNVVIDHSTMIWGPDVGGVTFLNGARDSTVSYSIIGEGLYYSDHPEAIPRNDGHSMSLNITQLKSSNFPARITIHHNLITTSSDRNPRVIGGENIDIVNNVIYNWRGSPSQGNPRSLNLINNYYIKGPMSTKASSLVAWLPKVEKGGRLRRGVVYENGNLAEGLSKLRGSPTNVYAVSRFTPYSMETEDNPEVAYEMIVNDVGANLQVASATGDFVKVRDTVDTRIIDNLVNRTGTFYNGVGYDGRAGFPEITWPSLAGGEPTADTDNDGLPDGWESTFLGVTTFGSSTNSSSDFDADGYTDLEEYLYGTNPAENAPAPSTPPTSPVSPQAAEEPVLPIPATGLLLGEPILAQTIAPASFTRQYCPDVVATLNLRTTMPDYDGNNPLNVVGTPNTYLYHAFQDTRPRETKVVKVILRLSCRWVE